MDAQFITVARRSHELQDMNRHYSPSRGPKSILGHLSQQLLQWTLQTHTLGLCVLMDSCRAKTPSLESGTSYPFWSMKLSLASRSYVSLHRLETPAHHPLHSPTRAKLNTPASKAISLTSRDPRSTLPNTSSIPAQNWAQHAPLEASPACPDGRNTHLTLSFHNPEFRRQQPQ